MSFEWRTASLRTPGYYYEGLADALYFRHGLDVEHIIPLIQSLNAQLPEEDLNAFSEGLATGWPYSIKEADVPKLCRLIPYLREQHRPLFCYRLGIAIRLSFKGSISESIERFESQVPPEVRHWTRRGEELVVLYPPLWSVDSSINRVPLGHAGGVQLFFLNGSTYPSNDDSYWVVGGGIAQLLYATAQPVKGLSVTLINGIKPNQVAIQAGDESRAFEMGPGQAVRTTMPLNQGRRSGQKYLFNFAIKSQRGYFPGLVSESNDSRYLGVKVKAELIPLEEQTIGMPAGAKGNAGVPD